jgi:hypothetical protein
MLALIAIGAAAGPGGAAGAEDHPAVDAARRIPAGELRADVRQLTHLLETAHPDPYQRGGGKVAFHRRLHRTLAAIPDTGMTRAEFYTLVSPLVAAVRDGHTNLWIPDTGGGRRLSLPLGFRVVGAELVIMRVHDQALRSWIGGRLRAVEGVPFAELIERQRGLAGYDNEVHNLLKLGHSLVQWQRLTRLIPELAGRAGDEPVVVALTLARPGHEPATVRVPLVEELPAAIEAPSTVELPAFERAAQVFGFLDSQRTVAVLRIDNMMGYREAFEWNLSRGFMRAKRSAGNAYERANDRPAPEDPDSLVAGIPAATDLFRELVVAMREAGTRTLLIDLRGNAGGNSAISAILIYFLHGREVMASAEGGYQIRKYSALYFDNYTKRTLDDINEDRELPLERGDYDFASEVEYRRSRAEDDDLAEMLAAYDRFFAHMPTFHAEFVSGEHEAHYLPRHVVVLGSAGTRSAAFDLLVDLYRLGATIVGTPSAQAGNCFIDTLGFELDHSGLRGGISYKYSLLFPEDPERGDVFRPHHELDYETLETYGFDPNAEVRLALDVLGP